MATTHTLCGKGLRDNHAHSVLALLVPLSKLETSRQPLESLTRYGTGLPKLYSKSISPTAQQIDSYDIHSHGATQISDSQMLPLAVDTNKLATLKLMFSAKNLWYRMRPHQNVL